MQKYQGVKLTHIQGAQKVHKKQGVEDAHMAIEQNVMEEEMIGQPMAQM